MCFHTSAFFTYSPNVLMSFPISIQSVEPTTFANLSNLC